MSATSSTVFLALETARSILPSRFSFSSSVNFTPAYDPAVYKDLQLFMPYDALNMESGETYDLKFYLALYQKDGSLFFGKSGWYKFQLTMP